jgi:general secretion pathway protein A
MYLEFYGLREAPFELTPNPRFLFLTPQHREALSNLEYGLLSAKPLTVVIGEAGTGKTTLLSAALASSHCLNVKFVHVSNPTLTRGEFMKLLARGFALGPAAAECKTDLLTELEACLLQRRARGEVTALVVDEAQSLSSELLEEIRLLANIETPEYKLLPLVMVGQPELRTRLNDPALRQLKQRVALRCEIVPFEAEDTAAYIASRIATAGGDPFEMFTRDAIILIHERSSGIPRTINVICDNALMGGLALNHKQVHRDLVLEVCRDFDLPAGTEARDAAQRIVTRDVPAGGGPGAASSQGETPGRTNRPEYVPMPRRFRIFAS